MNGIERIQQYFSREKIFAAYLTAGDGGMERTLSVALALIDGGVNMLEIGVPFSDPVADGPVIQKACVRALAAGTRFSDILDLIAQIRKNTSIPIILFSYLNPLWAARERLGEKLKLAGVDGVLIVDAPIEESHSIYQEIIQQHIAPIYIIAPTTSAERISLIGQSAAGFLYYACRKGTTGIRCGLPENFAEKIRLIKSNTKIPVIAGFGIADANTAKQVITHADGVVMGSIFVNSIAANISTQELVKLTQSLNPNY
jgi:tryptophan synthase alpha chain